MRALVTGGAGFIGSHLVRRLIEENYDVTVVDDLSTGKRENLPDTGTRFVIRDLSRDALDDLTEGVDVIFHLAAVPSVPRSVAEPLRSHEAAATATLRLLEAARRAGVSPLVKTSSPSGGGNASTPPMLP